jgi:penicillin-binding protein 1A
MARAYAVFANGGYLVDPYFLATITDRDGNVIYRADPARVCAKCPERTLASSAGTQTTPAPAAAARSVGPIGSANAGTPPTDTAAAGSAHLASRVIDARNAYLVTSLMRDVVRRGTGSAAGRALKRGDLAGKTGTTNEHRDAWFSGFDAREVATAWVGLDDFGSLGRGEFGAKAALPMWIDFMRIALDDVPEQPFDAPPGIATARIDAATGMLAASGDPNAILEVFKSEDIGRLEQASADQERAEQRDPYDVF